eukprot:jgi/Ulvmu1/6436/UM003_0065.1
MLQSSIYVKCRADLACRCICMSCRGHLSLSTAMHRCLPNTAISRRCTGPYLAPCIARRLKRRQKSAIAVSCHVESARGLRGQQQGVNTSGKLYLILQGSRAFDNLTYHRLIHFIKLRCRWRHEVDLAFDDPSSSHNMDKLGLAWPQTKRPYTRGHCFPMKPAPDGSTLTL